MPIQTRKEETTRAAADIIASEDYRSGYQSAGYVLLPDLLPDATLARLRAVTDAIVATAATATEHTEILDLEPGHTQEAPRVRRIKRPHLAHDFYLELAADPHIMAALTPLIGPDIRLRAGGKINMKSADYGAAVEWHQDWAFYPHTNQNVLAVGIMLDDMTLDNGPLMMMPGSHTGPVLDHHAEGAFCGAIDMTRDPVDIRRATHITAPAGSITVHHARLIHGSAMNHSSSPRRVLFFEYAAADAWPLAGVETLHDLDEFNSRIVQGQATLQPRLENVPVRMPLPIARFQGSIYENQRQLGNRFFDND
jgi:phytanoyl-CoA hydroxylase